MINETVDFMPCHHFDHWLPQAIAVIGAAAAEIHQAALYGEKGPAYKKLAAMIPAMDGLADEFRMLLGYSGRPDVTEETTTTDD